MADDPDSARFSHKRPSVGKSALARERAFAGFRAQAANLLTVARFGLAAAWIAIFLAAPDHQLAYALIAIGAAVSDMLDGMIARRIGASAGRGRWLDPIADVVFVVAALGCAAAASAIPVYIPILIALSFAQYVLDSRLLHHASGPLRSRLGHYGGIINYGLVLGIGIWPAGSLVRLIIKEIAPAVAIFYLAAIVERILAYRAR